MLKLRKTYFLKMLVKDRQNKKKDKIEKAINR